MKRPHAGSPGLQTDKSQGDSHLKDTFEGDAGGPRGTAVRHQLPSCLCFLRGSPGASTALKSLQSSEVRTSSHPRELGTLHEAGPSTQARPRVPGPLLSTPPSLWWGLSNPRGCTCPSGVTRSSSSAWAGCLRPLLGPFSLCWKKGSGLAAPWAREGAGTGGGWTRRRPGR